MPLELFILIGLLAGILATIAGLGGGLLMVVCLTFFLEPTTVLAVTAPALVVGHAGRVWMFRHQVCRATATAFVLGSLPGIVFGALVLLVVTEDMLRYLLGAAALAYVAHGGLRELRRRPSQSARIGPPAVAGAGLASGILAASVGGGGVMVAPALQGRRLETESFVATAATVGAAINIGRTVGYGALGFNSVPLLVGASALAGGMLLGNVIGRPILRHVPQRVFRISVLMVVGVMAISLLAAT
jgi:uncharacterized membrane protein YfcA